MTHAYSEMYLEDAMRTLGEAVDFALCDQGLTPAELTAILSNAFEMKQFERGMPRVRQTKRASKRHERRPA